MRFAFMLSVLLLNSFGLFAQASSSVPQDLGGWLAIVNVGLAGVGLLAFARKWIVPGVIYNEALEREKLKDQEIALLRKNIDDQILPELRRSKETQEKMMDLTGQFLRVVEKQKESN